MPRDPTSPNPPDPAPPRRTDSARRTPSRTPSRTPPRTLSHTPSLGVAVTPIDPLQVLVDTRRPLPPHCPRCGGAPLIRWGTFSGRQRYRCKACGRTSSDLTGTALAYTKKLPLWGEFAAGMLEGESCRQGARRLGIHKDTAWRWRHRLLECLLERLLDSTPDASVGLMAGVPRGPTASPAVPAALLGGTVELLEARVLVCRKGERNLERPALRRGRRFPILPGLGGRATAREPAPAPTSRAIDVRRRDERWDVASEIATLLLAHDRREHARATLVWHAAPPTMEELAALLALPSEAPDPDAESQQATLHATLRATRHASRHTARHTARHAAPHVTPDPTPHATPHATSHARSHATPHTLQHAGGQKPGGDDDGRSPGIEPVAAGRIAAGGGALRLLSRGRLHSPYGDLARRYGLDHRRVPFTAPGWQTADPQGRRRPRRAQHLGTASGALRRLRAWLRRFHGVATKYLLRYWAWHRFLDVLSRDAAAMRLLASAGRRGA